MTSALKEIAQRFDILEARIGSDIRGGVANPGQVIEGAPADRPDASDTHPAVYIQLEDGKVTKWFITVRTAAGSWDWMQMGASPI